MSAYFWGRLCLPQFFIKCFGSAWLLFFCSVTCFGQNEKAFQGYPQFINGVISTYDSAIIIGFSDILNSTNKMSSVIIKQGSNRRVLWRINIRNLWIRNMIPTQDSGFLITGDAAFQPDSNTAHLPGYDVNYPDTITKAALLKFDKCGKLLWGKYLSATFLSTCQKIVEAKDGSIFASSIVGIFNDRVRKYVGILKFSKDGDLLKDRFFEGIGAVPYYDPGENSLYFTQDAYIPLPGDTSAHSFEYLYTGVKKLDMDLHTKAQIMIGYDKQWYNEWGPLLLYKDRLVQVGNYSLQHSTAPYFAPMDKNLNLLSSDFILDNDNKNLVYPMAFFGGIAYGDSLVTLNQVRPSDHTFNELTSLRLYDKNFSLLKKVDINKDYDQAPKGMWELSNGDFVASVANRNYYYGSLFLFDRNLNPVAWSTKPPVRGYDWACTDTIPPTKEIKIPDVLQPVNFQLDTTRPDWNWIWYDTTTSIKNFVQTRQSGSWMIFPQPLSNGSNLYLRLLNGSSRCHSGFLKADFYDLLGRKIVTKAVISVEQQCWVIPALQLPSAGLYLLRLTDKGGHSEEMKIWIE